MRQSNHIHICARQVPFVGRENSPSCAPTLTSITLYRGQRPDGVGRERVAAAFGRNATCACLFVCVCLYICFDRSAVPTRSCSVDSIHYMSWHHQPWDNCENPSPRWSWASAEKAQTYLTRAARGSDWCELWLKQRAIIDWGWYACIFTYWRVK